MKVADLLERRYSNWKELESLCAKVEGQRTPLSPEATLRFAALYRATCADLALADSYQLPQQTVTYLHHLVGRAHNQLYRSRKFDYRGWARELFEGIPQRLFRDGCVRLAFLLFWGFFLGAMLLAYVDRGQAEQLVGKAMMEQLDEMYADEIGKGRDVHQSGAMAGFYIQHNTSIGLQCFASGLVFGVLGLFTLIFNAALLGGAFGYMASTESSGNFFNFVTAHGPFELTAIVLSAAAGMRMGFAIIHTGGWTRQAALFRAAQESVPTMSLAMLFFFFAALIEGFLSPSALPYAIKAAVAILSTAAIVVYIVVLGYPRRGNSAGVADVAGPTDVAAAPLALSARSPVA